jgi:hypothetical protein
MRAIIGMFAIIYLVGVGIALTPTVQANWSTVPTSQLFGRVATELPKAVSWPATACRSISERS